MLSKSFKSGKCKTSLKLAVSRIKLLKNKRDIQVRHLRRELAHLLATGQEQTARIRVEHVIREEKTMSGYDLIEIYCELIVARLPIIESQKSCPIDLKEAISSVIFASPRCADLPELVDVRKHFSSKYGKDFITSALELRPDCGVNRMIVEKLSAKAPDTEMKIKILTAIAKEHDVKWDPKAVEEELQNPKDLLNGSSSFMRANEIRMEPLNVNFSPVASRKEADSKIHQNEIPTKPTSFNSTSPANLRTSTFPVPPTWNESMKSANRKSGVLEVRDSYSHTETVSSNQPTWTEFKDAISAAEVAAESAERASIAARAAAELATRGNISRQNSSDPNRSSIYSSRNTLPNIVPSSKLKDVRNESVKMDDNLVKDFQGVKDEVDKLPRDELRGGISHLNADDVKVYSQINNGEKFDSIQKSFSRIKSVGSKKENGEADFIEDAEVNYDGIFFASSLGPPDDDTIWFASFGKQQHSNTHEVNDHKLHTSSDYASAVFVEYGPAPNNFKNHILDSFDNKKNDHKLFSTSPTNSFSDSLHESHAATLEKVSSAKFDDNNTVTYDDSDGTAEDEDELSSSLKNGTVQNSRLLQEERGSRQESGPQVELQPSSSSKAKPLMGSAENDHLQVPSCGPELDSGGELGLKFGRLTGGLKNRGHNYPPPYTASSVVHSSLPSKEIADSIISSAEQPISRREKAFASLVTPDEDRYDEESSWKAYTSADSGKAEGSQLEEYTEVSRCNITLARDKSVEDTSCFGVNEFISSQEYSKQYTGGNLTATNVSEAFIEKIDDEKPHTKAYKELSSRMSRTDFDLDGDGEKRNSDISIESHGNASANSKIKLSRRTRDFTTNGRINPKSNEFSDIPNSESERYPLSRAVDEAKILQGNPILKPPKQNSSAERVHEDSLHKVNIKNTEGRPIPVTTVANSGNNNTLDSGDGTKLQGTESNRALHVHPKLPDYDTLAAHFQSLRSNRR